MVRLLRDDIKTSEVLDWDGVHLLHSHMSSCSQKVRIFMNLKKMKWQSHLIDVSAKQNLTSWFMGINPRGLVPVLIHDGEVHIESNDIMLYLERHFPAPPLFPRNSSSYICNLLKAEDDLHLDLRRISFRFLLGGASSNKSAEDLRTYAKLGSGTVRGKRDDQLDVQIQFWKDFAKSDRENSQVCESVRRFCAVFSDLESRLRKADFLLGDAPSVLDISWIVGANRLKLAGYPLERFHPRLAAWLEELRSWPEIGPEIAPPANLNEACVAAPERFGRAIDASCFNLSAA